METIVKDPLNEAIDAKRKKMAMAFIEKFSLEEQSKIALVPLIIAHIAWTYAERARMFGVSRRISETKSLSRAIQHLRAEYIGELQICLDQRHIDNIYQQTEKFMAQYNRDFQILYFSTANNINRMYKHIEYDELRTYAFLSMQFIKTCREYENKMTEFIRQRIGIGHESHLPTMSKLYDCMDAYLGDYEVKENDDLHNALKIFHKNLDKIKFELDKFL